MAEKGSFRFAVSFRIICQPLLCFHHFAHIDIPAVSLQKGYAVNSIDRSESSKSYKAEHAKQIPQKFTANQEPSILNDAQRECLQTSLS